MALFSRKVIRFRFSVPLCWNMAPPIPAEPPPVPPLPRTCPPTKLNPLMVTVPLKLSEPTQKNRCPMSRLFRGSILLGM